jgi:hypothetical protein
VTAPYVNVKTRGMAQAGVAGRNGWTIIGVYMGGLLPEDAPPEDVQRMLRRGLIEAVEIDG